MEENKSFDIKINTRYPLIHEFGLALLFTAMVGFGFLYLINLPVKDQPELTIPYYFWLPQWLSDTVSRTALLTALAFVLGFALLAIRKNTLGKMKIFIDRIEIKSKSSLTILKYGDLKRITFVESSWPNPYRIQFVFKNSALFRIKIPSELELTEIHGLLTRIAPKGLELYDADFDGIDM